MLRRWDVRVYDVGLSISLASKGYIPIVRRGLASPGGYGARIRDRAYNESLYAYRSVGEGMFGALTVEFGDRVKVRRKSTEIRTLLRITICCPNIIGRWIYDRLDTIPLLRKI